MSTIPIGSLGVLGQDELFFFDGATGSFIETVMLTSAAGPPGTQFGFAMDAVLDGTLAVEHLPGQGNDPSSWQGLLFPNSPNAIRVAFMGGMNGSGSIYNSGSAGDQASVFAGLFLNYELGIDQHQSHIQLTDKTGASVNYWRVNAAVPPGVNGDCVVARFAVNPGASVLYYGCTDRNGLSDGKIHALNLTDGTNLPDFADESGGFPTLYPTTITVSPNGDVIALWSNGDGTYTVKQYDSAGATLQTWTTASYFQIGQGRSLDSLSVWISYTNNMTGAPTVEQIILADGSVGLSFDLSATLLPANGPPSFYLLPAAWTINAPVIIGASFNCQTGVITITGVSPSFGTPGDLSILDPSSTEVAGDITSWSPDRIVASMTYTTAGTYTVTVTPSVGSPSVPFAFAVNCNAPVVTYPVRREHIFPLPWDNENCQKFISRLEFIIQAGIGNAAAPNPQMMVSVSRDGEETFGPETMLAAGAVGEYTRRVFVNRLGRARNPVIKLVVSDPVNWQMLQCLVDMTKGTS